MTAMMKNMTSTINALTNHNVDLATFRNKKQKIDWELGELQYSSELWGNRTWKQVVEDTIWNMGATDGISDELAIAYQKACWWKQDGQEWIFQFPRWTDVLEQYLKRYCFC